ncbi:MAG: DUF2784 domain-containing protein [Acidimicrobiaceae bacterium]|nr:DUF2784 domain-containing protein [Acidimicrobiaceae bacterium]MYD05427.1 DUF2784 domain-containing protein [Acidimicrobiaceae bacterium]MYI59886.1 DUF2784 domain-containing protein [Acidimicrobiaceae bacterium]
MVYWSLAIAMALAHGLLAVFLVFGAPVAAHRPRVMRWYLAMLAPTAAVNILSLPCPLTVWEKDFWRLAGETPYRGGFISHYFVEPFYAPGLSPSGETALLIAMVLWCLPWLLYPTVSRTRRADAGSIADIGEQNLVDEPLVYSTHSEE